MALFKFRCDLADGFSECNVRYRTKQVLDTLGAMAQNDETRNYDDADPVDAACIKSLDAHFTLNKSTGQYDKTFTKIPI